MEESSFVSLESKGLFVSDVFKNLFNWSLVSRLHFTFQVEILLII